MNASKIPAELLACKQWVLWKLVKKAGDKKPTKLPFQPDGTSAKSNTAATWSSFEDANETLDRGGFSGVGFVFSEHDPYCGIDLDGCRNPETGEVSDWARKIITKLNSYAEVSPSETGVKIWIRGKFPFETGKKVVLKSAPRICDKEPAIEVYDRLRYFAVTGHRVGGGVSPNIEERQDELNWIVREYIPQQSPAGQDYYGDEAVIERARKYIATMAPAVSGSDGHTATFKVACALVLGFGLSPGQAAPLLDEYNQKCAPPWSERELKHKLESAAKQSGRRNYLRNTREEDWGATTLPDYQERTTPARVEQSPPDTTTLEQTARDYLASLASGKSSLIETGLPEVDYAIGGGIEPGEMVILAARPSHGKSAAALQVIHHVTEAGFPSAMISEEMSKLAIGKRVLQYASSIPQEHWPTDGAKVTEQIDQHFKTRAKCVVVESCGSVERASMAIREAVERDGIKFAVVDYAQLLSSKGRTRYEQITATSIALRQLASQTKIAILVLCQLSRDIEKRDKFLPTNADLKDSGQLEQDADVILFLCWPHRLNPKNNPHEFLFFVGKNRNRAINQSSVKCHFEPSRQMLTMERAKQVPYDEWQPAEPDEDSDWSQRAF